jgi:signal transduction histidine kinase
MAEKLAMTGNIARSIAHEVRNPLTNLNLALEQLDDDLRELPDGDHKMYVDIIQRNANRIDQLITEMLESSKPKEPDLSPYNLNQLLDSVIEMTSDRIKLMGIELTISKDASMPDMQLDPDQMKTALLNIVINAIESMEEEENGKLEVGTLFRDGQMVVYVKDNGKGIPREQLRKLFDPFFTGKRGGMGLGLTSSQNIINSHKGKVDVESEPGKGTRFEISFSKKTN